MTGWAVGETGYCTMFDGVGNENPMWATVVAVDPGWHVPYSCSSTTTYSNDPTFAYALLSPDVVT